MSGRGFRFWPRPGRIMMVDRQHTMHDLAMAIVSAFGFRHYGHLYTFLFPDGQQLGETHRGTDPPNHLINAREAGASEWLTANTQFAYHFDYGEDLMFLCTVEEPPAEIYPDPTADIWVAESWGALPDQYGRRWRHDEGLLTTPPPDTTDLPHIGDRWLWRIDPDDPVWTPRERR